MTDRYETNVEVIAKSDAATAAEIIETHDVLPLEPAADPLTKTLTSAARALLTRQSAKGFWHFELEADATIPSEYLMLHHFLDSVDGERQQRIVAYLKRRQMENGSWALFEGGPGNISATVKAYFALKLAGEEPDAEFMRRARRWVHANGGAEKVNVFTRIALALFGQMPWRVVPAMPIEFMFLPNWWFINLKKVSYWSRCVIVPLLIIMAARPVHKVPATAGIRELFLTDPDSLKHLDHFSGRLLSLENAFIALDRVLRLVDGMVPRFIRSRAVRRAEIWMRDHMQGSGGIGAIYPAMANAAVALKLLGAADDDPDMVRNLQAIEDLVLDKADETYVQPCLSPIWDTCLSLTALTESGAGCDTPAVRQAVEWLFDQQIFVGGDWEANAPGLASGGWCFQFENDKYPDVDDTGMVLMALLRAGAHEKESKRKHLNQAVNWLLGMQNPDGSWGAFDIGNNYEYLNKIPFADHDALVDPGTADLTSRCIEILAMLGYDASFDPIARGLAFLEKDQEECGAWYGRWGVNYIYGTWSVLSAVGILEGEDVSKPYIQKAVTWLRSIQNDDGGWGESCSSYDDKVLSGQGESTASQTAWALLGLMAAGDTESAAVTSGIDYLIRTQNAAGEWDEEIYTGTGFPRVFYLRYHGYSKYFPLWALAIYARARRGIPTRQSEIQFGGPIDLEPFAVLNPA